MIAFNKGGNCISNKYINNKSYLRWKCARNHEWNATLDSIKNKNSQCPYCAGQAKNTLDIANMVAINKGGDCISNEYINGSSHLRWKCAKGHEWNATLESVKNRDSWCLICAANVKYQGSWCPFCQNKRQNICREILTNYLGPPSENF